MHVDWPKPVKLLTPYVPNPEVLDDLFNYEKKLSFMELTSHYQSSQIGKIYIKLLLF